MDTPFTIWFFESFWKQKKHPKKSANFGLKMKKPRVQGISVVLPKVYLGV